MRILRTLSAWLYGVEEEDVKRSVRSTEDRIHERSAKRKTVEDSTRDLSTRLRSAREGRR